MILDAMTALLSFPRVISHKFRRSLMTVTRNLFSCSSSMDPLIDPIAQQRVLRPFQDSSRPFWSCDCKQQQPQVTGKVLMHTAAAMLLHVRA